MVFFRSKKNEYTQVKSGGAAFQLLNSYSIYVQAVGFFHLFLIDKKLILSDLTINLLVALKSMNEEWLLFSYTKILTSLSNGNRPASYSIISNICMRQIRR